MLDGVALKQCSLSVCVCVCGGGGGRERERGSSVNGDKHVLFMRRNVNSIFVLGRERFGYVVVAFFSFARSLGECSTIHSPPALSFFLSFFLLSED